MHKQTCGIKTALCAKRISEDVSENILQSTERIKEELKQTAGSLSVFTLKQATHSEKKWSFLRITILLLDYYYITITGLITTKSHYYKRWLLFIQGTLEDVHV